MSDHKQHYYYSECEECRREWIYLRPIGRIVMSKVRPTLLQRIAIWFMTKTNAWSENERGGTGK